MNVRNCRKCGRIFNYISGVPICPACKEAEEKKFQDVKNYLYDNPRADIPDIVRDCGVDQQTINQWIREERLSFTDDSPIGIQCERCGAMIKSGRFCDKCKYEVAHSLNEAIKKPESPAAPAKKVQSSESRMRFLDRQ